MQLKVEDNMDKLLQLVSENAINKPLVARIKAQMARKGLNPKTLAERANVGRSFIYDILSGKSTNPTSAKLGAVAEQLGVSVTYLLTGQQTGAPAVLENSEIVEIAPFDLNASNNGVCLFRTDWILQNLHTSPENLRVVFVNGDSMETTLQNGDMVLVNITKKIPNAPGLFVIFDGMGPVAKRLEMLSPARARVISDNPRYSPYEKDLRELNIVGKVVWLSREV